MKLISVVFLVFSMTVLQGQHSIIPAPASWQEGSGTFDLSAKTGIVVLGYPVEVQKVADFFRSMPLVKNLNMSGKVTGGGNIKLELLDSADSGLGKEGYDLDISSSGIHLRANNAVGLFYGVQTIGQLIPLVARVTPTSTLRIPACKIRDTPRLGWRGLMLDVSRHFFTVDEVKQYIDAMAMYKLNTLHLHLTDDNGWRIEIKSLPKLTSVGAWRVERHGTFGDRAPVKEGEPATYGGFYTHEQIRELVRYAESRFITIVPEIDVPGHSMAMLAAYPELSCTHEKVYVNPGTNFAEWFGDGKFKMLVDNTLNPSNELVYDYLDKVFTEVAMLFPNPYIHVGGDECYHGYWEKDPGCLALMKKENLKNSHELQSYFIKRLEKILKAKNKKLLGWDEILEGGLAPEATVMSWRGMQGGIDAAKLGHDVVMSPTTFAYIDYMQGDPAMEFPIYASLTLRKIYSFEPVPEGVDAKYILGGQANLWTEKVPTLRHAFYMTYPRAFALAESVWSPKSAKNWDQFTGKVEEHFKRFDYLGWNISRSLYDAVATVKKTGEKLTCELKTEMPGAEIHYTLDNTFPDAFTPQYTGPFEIPEGDVTLRFITVKNGSTLGRMIVIPRKDLAARAR